MTSTRKGSAKKPGQKYQNASAFRHNKNSKRTKEILALPVSGLCVRCTEIVQWRKQYRKYKPLSQPKKCVGCEQKKVRDAYHILCDQCATTRQVCAKCQSAGDILETDFKSLQDLQREQAERDRLLASMTERERRTYLRQLERQNNGEHSDHSESSEQEGESESEQEGEPESEQEGESESE